MEIIPPSHPRLKLVLGKYPVTQVRQRPFGPGFDITVKFHEVSFTMSVPFDFIDVRVGDLVTPYIDLPYKDPNDAPPLPTPVQ